MQWRCERSNVPRSAPASLTRAVFRRFCAYRELLQQGTRSLSGNPRQAAAAPRPLITVSLVFIVFRNHGLWPWVSGYAPAQLLTNCLSPYGGLTKAPCFARGLLLGAALTDFR